jgi:hypothetical protein
MKVELLCLDSVNKSSPISEGVMEIRINSQPCKGINLTTRHTQARRVPRVATVHDMVNETIRTDLTLVHVIHAYASADAPWVAHALSQCTSVRYGRIASVSAPHAATQFAGPHESCMRQYTTQSLFIRTEPMWALINTGRGFHLGAPNL